MYIDPKPSGGNFIAHANNGNQAQPDHGFENVNLQKLFVQKHILNLYC
jgi:hypothetical protein